MRTTAADCDLNQFAVDMFWLILLCAVLVNADYNVPAATVEVFHPKGLRVSIPDEEGIKLFAFHGKVNKELNGREGGTFSRDITKAKNGRWTFYDPSAILKVGDTLYYWTYVDYFDGRNKLGYANDDQEFVVKELINQEKKNDTSTKQPSSCSKTETTPKIDNLCAGNPVFSDDFTENVPSSKFWTVEQKYADAPDYEFVLYKNLPETLQINNGILKIKPILSEDHFGKGFVTSSRGYDFKEDCTGTPGSPVCKKIYFGGYYLPPVVSSQLSTKGKFGIKYGKIEIRAKLPKGDWIYPELYLNPVYEEYGSNNQYQSGQIRVAFTPGNAKLNNELQGGAILGDSPAARKAEIKTAKSQKGSWSDDFHKFTLIWKPDSISLSVDDLMYGNIYPPADGFSRKVNQDYSHRWKTGSALAPFDKEMYLTVGVGVGGFNFEDTNDGTKPWTNGERLSVKKFHEKLDDWYSTWDDNSALEVDYVKVWAV